MMNRTDTYRGQKPATGYRLPATGFTLIELMVVISVIILLAAIALPTMTGLFTSGQDQQAFNIFSAQLSAARALAITKGTYAGVHVQMADNPDYTGKCYSAVVIYDSRWQTFDLADGYQPQAMPGSMAFGQIRAPYVDDDEYDSDALESDDSTNTADWLGTFAGFTTFTIVFSPSGEVVTSVDGGQIVFYDPTKEYDNSNPFSQHVSGLFAAANENDDFTETQLWRVPKTATDGMSNYNGVLAVTLFDYKVVLSIEDRDKRKDYLDEFGQFLALNLYTGKFFARE